MRIVQQKKRIIPALVFLVVLTLIVLLPYFKPSVIKLRFPEPAAPAEIQTLERKRASLQKGDYILFGRYNGQIILWRVLAVENGKPLLFSEAVLCFKAFTGADNVVGGASWERSALRQWLNSEEKQLTWGSNRPDVRQVLKGYNAYDKEAGFLQDDNFNPAERALFLQGKDRVTLLTKEMLIRLVEPAARQKKPTRSAALQEESPYFLFGQSVWYWTRSPISTNQSSVTTVTAAGSFYKSLSTDGLCGVCPALYLQEQMQSVAFLGDGSRSKPYLISGGARFEK